MAGDASVTVSHQDKANHPGTRWARAGEVPVRVDVDQPVLVGRPAFPANRVERNGNRLRSIPAPQPSLVEHLGHGRPALAPQGAMQVPGEARRAAPAGATQLPIRFRTIGAGL